MHHRLIRSTLPVVLSLFSPVVSHAAEVTGYASLTSDFVRRGVTQSDSDPALQLGGDVALSNGLFFGAWGSTADVSNGPSRQRDLEVDYYVGYSFAVAEKWQMLMHAVLYTYPGQTGNVDYDYHEFSVTTSYDDRAWLEYSYAPDIYHSDRSTSNIDLYVEWPLNSQWSVGGGGGYYDTSDLTGSGYGYWQLGVSRVLKWADLDIRYHDTNRSIRIFSTPDRAKSRISVTLQVPFSF